MTSTENYAILKENSKTFYLASSFLPAKVRYKVLNVYAFCRKYDDSADSDIKIKNPDVDRIIADLKISNEVINQLKIGIDSDRNFKRLKKLDDLIVYSYRVAGCVGLMMCELLDIRNSNDKYYAIDLGIAMQITNVCRDVFEDLNMERIYLPEEIISDVNIKTEDEKNKLFNKITNLIEISERYYNSALHGIKKIPIGSRFSILVSLRLYQAIGRKIVKNRKNYFIKKIHTTKFEKFIILLRCLVEFGVSHIYNKKKQIHNQELHLALRDLPFTHGKV